MIKSVTIRRRGVVIVKVIDRKGTGVELFTNAGIEADLSVEVRDENNQKLMFGDKKLVGKI